jgi:uncharacterized protein (TIGR02271 family)
MGATTHSIEVNAPLRAVYNQWTQFEEFPRFMEGIEEVRQEGEKRLLWKARIGGKVKQWEAEITDLAPDRRIAWQSVAGSPNSGTITFEEVDPERTMITATIEYEPEGFLEKTGDALGIPSGRVQGDLERFRDFIEERGRETGGRRGQIGEGEGLSQASGIGEERPTSGAESVVDVPPRDVTQEDRPVGSRLAEKKEGAPAEQVVGVPHRETAAAESRAESGDVEIPLSKEEVKVGKREVGAGEVRVRKKVETEQVNVPVELKREDAVIERVGPSETRPGSKEPFEEERIEVPLKREEPVIEKETRVTGGVRVRKTESVEQQNVQEHLRREDVDIDKSGRIGRTGGSPGEATAGSEVDRP